MPTKTKVQIALTFCLAFAVTVWAAQTPSRSWLQFLFLLLAILLSSSFKIALPRGDGSMSLNFPFILLGVVLLSPLQVILLTAISVAAQCRIRVVKIFTAVQILFNVANSMISAAAAVVVYEDLIRAGMAFAPALSLASVAYFLCNTASVAGVIASTKGENAFKVWTTEFPWYLPFYVVGAVLAAIASWMSKEFGWTTAMLLVPMVYTVYRAYTGHMSRLKERQQHLEETEALHLRTIEGLAMAIEAKDQGTHDHLFRVRSYVQEVGMQLKLSKLELQALHTAAFLHDIGKLAVPEHIINKPGKLTPDEFEKMKIHPGVGADILERVRFPYPVVPIVRSHHEWWDGSGYPDGLKGEEIPIGARILTVVDCFDALVSDRPYRKGMTSEKAMSIVKSMVGKQFDPKVVEVFEQQYAIMQEKIEQMTLPEFVPLNTEVAVSRGLAPGAGFANENGMKESTSIDGGDARRSEASLQLIATASQEGQSLFEMVQSLGSTFTGDEALSLIFLRLRRLVKFDSGVLYLKKKETVVSRFIEGDNAICFSGREIPDGEGISGWVGQSGKTIVNGNAMVESGCPSSSPLRSALSIPLLDLKREIFGVLTLYSTEVDSFRRDDLEVLQVIEPKLSRSIKVALELERELSAADLDQLTKLPSAKHMFLKLEAELAARADGAASFGVVVCDLNAFRQVNDLSGRAVGDRLLNSIAEELQRLCGSEAYVARVGGDEFTLLIPELEEKGARGWMEGLDAALIAASQRVGVELSVSASVGTAIYPADGRKAEDLLALAGRRMSLNKEAHYQSGTHAGIPPKLMAVAACRT